jgi:hypothetical protein
LTPLPLASRGREKSLALRLRPAKDESREAAENDCADLAQAPGRGGRRDHRRDGDRRTRPVRREASRHPQDRLRDNGDRDQLEAVQQALGRPAFQRARAIGEERHRDGGRQRESDPRGEPAEIGGAQEPDCETGLAARGARQELAERDQVRECAFLEPRAPDDELVAEIADVGDRPAERGQAELEKDAQDFEG